MSDKNPAHEGTTPSLVASAESADSAHSKWHDAEEQLRLLADRFLDPAKDWPSAVEIEAAILRVRSSPHLRDSTEVDTHIRILEAIRLGLTGHSEQGAKDLRAFAEQTDHARLDTNGIDDRASRAWEQSGKLFRIALDPGAALEAFRSAKRARQALGGPDLAVHEARLAHREAEALGTMGRLEEAAELLLVVEAAGTSIGDELLVARALASRGSISFENGQLTETVDSYERAIAIADRLAFPSYAMIWCGYLGQAKLHQGNLPEAEILLHRAIQLAKARGRSDAKSLFQSMLATIRTYHGRESLPEASRLFEEAIHDAKAFPLIEGTVRIQALHVRIAQIVERFMTSDPDGELPRALAGIAVESALLCGRPNPGRGGRILVDDSDDVRLALRLLMRRIEDVQRELSSARARVRVEIFSGSRAFRVDGRIVSLAARPTLQKVLAILAAGSSEDPPRAVRATEITDAVWPSDADPKAKLNRLYVSLAELRELGLRGSLQKSSDGYWVEGAKLIGARLPTPRDKTRGSSVRRKKPD